MSAGTLRARAALIGDDFLVRRDNHEPILLGELELEGFLKECPGKLLMFRSRFALGETLVLHTTVALGSVLGYTVEDGFLQQVPTEYVRVQNFIREVRKGREKKATATFFEIPDSKIRSILARAEANYDVPFDNDQ